MSFKTAVGIVPGQRRTGIAANGLPYFSHPSNNNTFGTNAWTADTLKATPFLCPRRLTLGGIAIRVTTTGTATLARLGIYKDDGNFYPGALLADFGTVGIGTTGLKEISGLSQILEANRVYWMATLLDGGVTLNVTTPSNIIGAIGTDPVTTQQGCAEWTVAQLFGALPDPYTAGAVYSTGGTRLVFMRF